VVCAALSKAIAVGDGAATRTAVSPGEVSTPGPGQAL